MFHLKSFKTELVVSFIYVDSAVSSFIYVDSAVSSFIYVDSAVSSGEGNV